MLRKKKHMEWLSDFVSDSQLQKPKKEQIGINKKIIKGSLYTKVLWFGRDVSHDLDGQEL